MTERKLRGVGIGAGYFSHFHHEAWSRIPEVQIIALHDRDGDKATAVANQYGIPRTYASLEEMLDREQPDFVDIVTPPPTHLGFVRMASARGIHIVCQKPLAPTYAECVELVETARTAGVRLLVHENFRWQRWYREVKQLLNEGLLGEPFSLYFRSRPGDGWGENAYLARQPFFRDYPRLLMYETGIHFIDTFRYLLGDIETVYARLRRLNSVIKGEDSGQAVFAFASGATAIWDANRYNENEARDPRLTFGELRLDASKGHVELDNDGKLTVKLLGEPSYQHAYTLNRRGFGGDCVYALQRHFADRMLDGAPFEVPPDDYLKSVQAMEACYASAATGQVVDLTTWQPES
jgi:predicted dehydrogenase